MIDLVAALATGCVGAFALVRSDVADTLPGVAIAISLVPPLAVVGLTFEEGLYDETLGAMLLFLTNVTAIIFTSTMVLLLYRVRDVAKAMDMHVGHLSGATLAAVVGVVALIAIPLSYQTQQLFTENLLRYRVGPIAQDWAQSNNWTIARLTVSGSLLTVTALGAPPRISPTELRQSLDDAGYQDVDLTVDLVVGGTESLPGTG